MKSNPELYYLEKAVELVDGQTAMAAVCSDEEHPLKQGHVWSWLHRSKKAPAEYVLRIEKAVGRKVTRYQLRPDVFGEDPAIAHVDEHSGPAQKQNV